MKRKLLVAGIMMCLAGFGMAQSVQILQFKESTHDFGTIKEEDGAVEHEFTFVNVSDRPIVIRYVKASCGCTTPGWSRDTIPVNGTGFVKARYNTEGRPGPFTKYLTVTSAPIGPPVKLYIKGNVTPRPKTVADEFPVGNGNLRTQFRVFNMGRVKMKDEPFSKSFPIYNEGETPMIFSDIQVPEHISIEFKPEEIPAGDRGELVLSYNTKLKNDYGFQNENIAFRTNEEGDESLKSFSVYTNIEEYFPAMTQKQLDEAPILEFDKVEHDFGRVKESSELKTTFKVTNKGKTDLLIRKIETNCACVLADISNREIKPGGTADLEVVFNTRSRRSNQQKAITVYANSPRKPITRVIIKSYVEAN